MARLRHKDDAGKREPGAWRGLIKFVGLVVLTTMLFLLAHSMVQHHFFTGGAMDYHNRPTGP
jgi:hypothetical protein